jgi:ATP-dependent helicase/DNAse subunit B
VADRIIYFGPFNNSKKEDLAEEAIESLKRTEGHRFYYLLPNGELLRKYRKEFITKVEQSFEINLFTFDDIVNEILSDEVYLIINEFTKDIIIKNSILKLYKEGKITYFKDAISMEGFIESLGYIIGEIKRSLIYPKNYLENCSSDNFREIGLIYSEYESELKRLKLIDRESAYFKAIEKLKDNKNYFKDLDFIIIDEFYDFRPIEMEILKEICKTDIDIYINIPFEIKTNVSNINKTISTLEGMGFRKQYVEKKEFNTFEIMGKNFFSDETSKLEYYNKLTLIKSPSIYLEFKRIFQEIKSLNKTGVDLSNIAIILLNDDYKDSLFQVAEEEEIPINLQKEISLIKVPLIKEYLNIFQSIIRKGHRESIINRVKSNYFGIIDKEYKDEMEFNLKSLKFNNLFELKKILEEGNSLNISMDNIDRLKDISEIILSEMDKVLDKDFIDNYNNIFFEVIDNYDIKGKVKEIYTVYKDYDLLYRDTLALEKLREIIDKMNQISLVMEEISIEDYYWGIIKLIEDEKIVEQNKNLKGIKILNPMNSRGFQYDIIFITGLSGEHYPLLQENNFLINDRNYTDLLKIKLDYKSYSERLNNEAIKFASLIASCRKKLYLSYSEGANEDSIPSIFLDEIISMFSGEKLEEKFQIINLSLSYLFKDNIRDITTIDELSNYLILNHCEDLSEEVKEYYTFHNKINRDKLKVINDKILCEYKRSIKSFNEYNGLISEDIINKDIKLFHKDKIYSNTYLEAYCKCPYAFLLHKVLNIEEWENNFEEYNPVDIGTIYHEVLRHYYNIYKEDLKKSIEDNESFIFENTIDILRQLVERYSTQIGLDIKCKKGLLIMENVFDKLRDFIKNDIERISDFKEKLIPYDFELEFGKYGDFHLDINGEKIRLRGKIDRIDKVLGKEKYLIMDYKSSTYGTYDIDHMSKGLSLQLPIYIMSQKNKDIIAGIYGIISNGEFQIKLGKIEETKLITKRHKGALDNNKWDELLEATKHNIQEIIEKISDGDFSINPLECSSYCIYKDICRYENVLEVE